MMRENRKSIGDAVYNTLYKNIINMTLLPGTIMSEKDISDRMEVSRTPVREAFIKLSKDGLVEIVPQKGTIVSKIDMKRVEEERFLRETLECGVLELFMKCKSEDSIYRMKRNLEKQKEALEKKEYYKFMEYDNMFHKITFDETNKNMCWNIIENASGHYYRIRLITAWMEDISLNVIEQHEELIERIVDNDYESAKKILKHHIRKIIIEEDEVFEKYPKYFKATEEDNVFGDNLFSDMTN